MKFQPFQTIILMLYHKIQRNLDVSDIYISLSLITLIYLFLLY